MDFSKINKIYMIGIKGVGMTMLAQFLAAKNFEVTGSDIDETFMTDSVLKKAGIKVIENFSENNIPHDADLIIYSSSYNKDTNVEVAKALNSKIKTINYAQALAKIFNTHKGIAVTGSHGKTTTSAWLGFVVDKANLKPNVMVGANVPQFDGNILVGESDYLVAEIDEYQNKLKYFEPRIVLLNNIDYDHPDFFPTQESYNQVFIDFIKKIPKKGYLIANFDDPIIQKIANVNCQAKIIGYSVGTGHCPVQTAQTTAETIYTAYDIKQHNGLQYFKVYVDNNDLGTFSIQLIGKHNIYNALAVIATCIELEIELINIRKYLAEFKGTTRRMQIMGQFNGATIIDDYAHHPTEIISTLAGVRELYKNKNLIVVFHPHTFTRTKALFDDFVQSFKAADEVIVLDIYGSAREEHGGVDSAELSTQLRMTNYELQINQEVKHIATLKECENYLRKNIKKNDIVLLMGAGDVFRVGENLVNY